MTYTLKVARIQSKYYVRKFFKYWSGWVPSLLFLLSFALFSIVFFPALANRLANRLSHHPEQLTLSGQVFASASSAHAQPFSLATDARLEIGGFSTTTDAIGTYELRFWTPQRDNITVVLRFGNSTTIETLSLPSTGNRWIRNWVVSEE